MSQTEVQLIKDNAVVDADITGMAASKLSGALPAISAASCTNIPAANITGALPAISGAALTNLPASGKATNLVINGDMKVNQKNISSSTSQGYQVADRWRIDQDSGLTEACTQSNESLSSGDTPYASGFRKAFRITNGNQTSQDGNDYIQLVQKIEAQDIATSGWNYTSNSSNITLSFWVKASIAQTFYVKIEATDASRTYTYPIAVTTSWQRLTKTIPGDSNLSFNNDEGVGMRICIIPYYGTNYTTSGHSINTWIASDGANQTPDFAATWFSGNDATFDVTGVQLEVGDSASDFAHERYSDSLAKCQRYFFMLAAHFQQTHDSCFGRGASLNDSVLFAFNPYYPVTMRTAPSAYTVTAGDGSFLLYEWNSYYNITGSWSIHATGPHSGQVYATCANVGGTNKVFRVQTTASAGVLGMDAEL